MKRVLILFMAMLLLAVSLPLQIFAISTEEENISKVVDVTALPFNSIINPDLNNLNTYEIQDVGMFSGNVYRYVAQEPTALAVSMIPDGSFSDVINLECIIFVFLLNNQDQPVYELVSSYYDVAWDSPVIELDEPGEYYIFPCNSAQSPSACYFNAIDVSCETDIPDFRETEVALPGEGDLWSWDASLRTLTLKNGFVSYSFYDTAISLPSDSKIIVEGECSMFSWTDAIHSEGNLEIILGEQANFSITTFSEYAIFTSNGNISIIGTGVDNSYMNVSSAHYGIYVGEEGSMLFSDCNMTIMGYESAIYNNNGTISIENSKINITNSLEGIINAYDADFVTVSAEYGMNIKSSTLNIDVLGNAIKCFKGDLIFIDFNSYISAQTGRGIITQESSSLQLQNGIISIYSCNESLIINDGKLILDNVAFVFNTLDEEKICHIDDGIEYNGSVRIKSADGNNYVGEWNDSFIKNGNIILRNENEENISAIFITAYWGGNADNNIVTGINGELCYDRDSFIFFEADVEEYALTYPNIGDTKWCVAFWQIINTDLFGYVGENGTQIEASLLSGGKYVLRVAFQKQYYSDEGWVFAEEPSESDFYYVDNAFEVAMPVIDNTDTGDCCPGLFSILSFMIITTSYCVFKIRRIRYTNY